MHRLLPKAAEGVGFPHSTASGSHDGKASPNQPLTKRGRPKNMVSAAPSSESPASLSLSTPKKVNIPIPTTSGREGHQLFRRFYSQPTAAAGFPTSILRQIAYFYPRLPYSIPDPLRNFLDGQWLLDTVIARCKCKLITPENLITRWHFHPTEKEKERFRRDAAQRLAGSKFARWVALVGVAVLESSLAGDVSQNQVHNSWVEYVEGSLKHELTLDLAAREICHRRSTLVHISLMKTLLIHTSDVYQLLRNITPTFLQVVYSTPTLWSSDCSLTHIPLSNIMASESHELTMFTLIDCTYAMATGLHQQIEYDTNIHSRPNGFLSHQWEHYSPIEFHLMLADINACRDKSPAARDWKVIEQWLLTWESQPRASAFAESWMTIAWYAAQETLRLALLIYLYLAICGASSDDSRIQSYVKQILQLIGTVKKREPSVNVSFFTQYLMVGICTRNEAYRRIARDGLLSPNKKSSCGLWLIRAPDFALVLDHLWHGAAAGGRPIKWSDYIHSRETTLPVDENLFGASLSGGSPG